MKSVGVLVLFLAVSASGGKILFFFPMAPKSSTMTYVPLAQELASRGHDVTVVSLFKNDDKKLPTLKEIVLKTKLPDFSDKLLSENSTSWVILSNWATLAENLAVSVMNELSNLGFLKHQEFDLVVAYGLATPNQIGYYLAKRWNATLVLYSAAQVSTIEYDAVFGQPHNTAILPFMITSLR